MVSRLVSKILLAGIVAGIVAGCSNMSVGVGVGVGSGRSSVGVGVGNVGAILQGGNASADQSQRDYCDSKAFAANYLVLNQHIEDDDLWANFDCMLANFDSVEQAKKKQREFVELRSRLYSQHGYKIALGNYAAQNLFSLKQPVVGYLFSDTLLANGVTIKKAEGRRLAFEPDLLATVKDTAINSATTIAQVAASIEQLSAFLEVPDLVVLPGKTLGPAFIATNAAVRFGVVGQSIKASADDAFLASLENMLVVASDENGQRLSTANGASLMGHPYNAVLFLLEELRRQDKTLQAGDVISLGAFASPAIIGDTQQVTVRYQGIGGRNIAVSASFE